MKERFGDYWDSFLYYLVHILCNIGIALLLCLAIPFGILSSIIYGIYKYTRVLFRLIPLMWRYFVRENMTDEEFELETDKIVEDF